MILLILLSTPFIATGLLSSYKSAQERMIQDQIISRGVKDEAVLKALRKVPRDEFVPDGYKDKAFEDHPLPIGHGQTISQPYIVAYMTEVAQLKSTDRVLEIGTGSGYQAAVLAEIVKDVYTIEIIPELGKTAEATLKRLGYKNVHVRVGDGFQGWKEAAPFDAILVTAAPEKPPPPLLEQLELGGRLIIPVGDMWQKLVRYTKTKQGLKEENLLAVRFVPMTGKAQED